MPVVPILFFTMTARSGQHPRDRIRPRPSHCQERGGSAGTFRSVDLSRARESLSSGGGRRRASPSDRKRMAKDRPPIVRQDGRGQIHLDPRRARAQSQEHRHRPAARQPDRDDRAVGLGQILARLRHDLRRGPAPLRGVALRLRAPVPGDDAEARRRPDRRALAGDLHRAEDDEPQPALHRRHRHRDLRLHAAALRARRHPLFAGDRAADREPDRQPDGRPHPRAARRHAALSARAGRARPQGRIPQGPRRVPEEGLPARQDRRRSSSRSPTPRRSTRSSSTTSTSWSTASSCAPTSPRASRIRSRRR